MKIKTILFSIAVLFSCIALYAQLPNHNMYVLANLNQHITTDTYSGCWGYIAPNGREYAILGTHLGTAFVDITDSANIHEVDFVPAPVPGSGNHWREITVYSHYAYVVTEAVDGGIEIIDLQYLPDSVKYITKLVLPNHTTSHTISVSGSFLYLSGGNTAFNSGGVTVLDLTVNPENPVRRGTWSSMYVHDCRVVNDTIFAANINNGSLSIINASDKNNLQFITSFQTTPHLATHNCAVTKDRKYIYTTDETGTPTAGSLKIYNIQNLSNITFVREWRPTGITTSQVHNVEIYGDTAIVGHRTAGVRVLNISNPANPVEIAWYDTYPSSNNNQQLGTWGVFMFPSKKIICSNKETGLWVLKTSNQLVGINHNYTVSQKFNLEQNFPNPFNPVTKINYSLASASHVKITVYDISGRLVATIENSFKKAGSHSAEFKPVNLSSGIYFYKLDVDNKYTEVKKMMLIK